MAHPSLFDDPSAPPDHLSEDWERYALWVMLTDVEVLQVQRGEMPASVLGQLQTFVEGCRASCLKLGQPWIDEKVQEV